MVDLEESKKMIAAATLWWCEKLTGLSVEGEGNIPEGVGGAMAMLIKASSNNDQESVKNFSENLANHLIDEYVSNRRSMTLGTDYGPEWPLSEILQKSGASGGRFPNKTTMWVNFEEGTVTWRTVRGPEGQIYPKKS